MRFAVPAVVVATLFLITPARAQIDSREGIALQNQIYQLRQELQQVQNRSGNGAPPAPAYQPQPQSSGGNDLVAQLLTRVDALEEQVRQLRGRIDETQNQVQQMQLDLNKKIDDLGFQMTSQAGQTAPPPPAGQSLQPPPLPSASPRPAAPRTPEVAMQEGFAALARHDYPAAEAIAKEVLANRTSPRAYDAKLLLAQALQGERQYPQAAVAYDDVYNLSRKGSHAQDALLGLANALASIQPPEKRAACDTLARLNADFPQPRPEIREAAAATAQKAACH
jgi:TolA-binding protein